MGLQEVGIWAWSREDESLAGNGYENESEVHTPILKSDIPGNVGRQHSVCFDPKNKTSLATTGDDNVVFWSWEEFNFEYYISKVPKAEFSHLSGKFSYTLFLPGTKTAITSTTDGYVIVWEPFHQRASNTDRRENASTRSHIKSASKVK